MASMCSSASLGTHNTATHTTHNDDDANSSCGAPSLIDENSEDEDSGYALSLEASSSGHEPRGHSSVLHKENQWCANMRRAKCSFHHERQQGRGRGCRFWHVEEFALVRLMREMGGTGLPPAMNSDFSNSRLPLENPILPGVMVKHHATLLQGFIHDFHIVEEFEIASHNVEGTKHKRVKRKRRGLSDKSSLYTELSELLSRNGFGEDECDLSEEGPGEAGSCRGGSPYKTVKSQIRYVMNLVKDTNPALVDIALLKTLYELDLFITQKCDALNIPLDTLILASADPSKKCKQIQKRWKFARKEKTPTMPMSQPVSFPQAFGRNVAMAI